MGRSNFALCGGEWGNRYLLALMAPEESKRWPTKSFGEGGFEGVDGWVAEGKVGCGGWLTWRLSLLMRWRRGRGFDVERVDELEE